MKKIIKQWGGSVGILFDVEDTKILNLQVGDIVNISIEKDINWEEMRKRVKMEKGK